MHPGGFFCCFLHSSSSSLSLFLTHSMDRQRPSCPARLSQPCVCEQADVDVTDNMAQQSKGTEYCPRRCGESQPSNNNKESAGAKQDRKQSGIQSNDEDNCGCCDKILNADMILPSQISPFQSVVWLAGGSASSQTGHGGVTRILPSEGCVRHCGPALQSVTQLNLFQINDISGWMLTHLVHQQASQTRFGETFSLRETSDHFFKGFLVMMTRLTVPQQI